MSGCPGHSEFKEEQGAPEDGQSSLGPDMQVPVGTVRNLDFLYHVQWKLIRRVNVTLYTFKKY